MTNTFLQQTVLDGLEMARQAKDVLYHYPTPGRGKHVALRVGRITENEDTLEMKVGTGSCAGMDAVVTREEEGWARVYVLFRFDPPTNANVWVGPIRLFSEYIEGEAE